jgi:competence protein ComEC
MVWLIAFLIFISPVTVFEKLPKELIVWNVGQGQWVTYVEESRCLHFDAGGEFFPQQKIAQACRGKKNILFLSHWDQDHLGFILDLKYLSGDLCLQVGPEGHGSYRKEKMLSKIEKCKGRLTKVRQLKTNLQSLRKSKSNDLSNVFVLDKEVLIPGDSPTKMEKLWSNQIKENIETLVVSHHGSRTATSEFFLEKVKIGRVAIASCRKKKYGHPHIETVQRLKKYHVPLLTTEDWGTIHILD